MFMSPRVSNGITLKQKLQGPQSGSKQDQAELM